MALLLSSRAAGTMEACDSRIRVTFIGNFEGTLPLPPAASATEGKAVFLFFFLSASFMNVLVVPAPTEAFGVFCLYLVLWDFTPCAWWWWFPFLVPGTPCAPGA